MRSASALVAMAMALLPGCGGGGGSAGTPILGGSPGSSGSAGSSGTSGSSGSASGSGLSPDPAGPSSSFAQQCAANNTLAASSLRTSTLDNEKKWLRAYVDEAYLWRDQVPRVDPGAAAYGGTDTYAAMDAYFEALKTPQLTDTGARRDRFSFTISTTEWNQLFANAVEAGYGIEWKLTSQLPPRNIRIAYVEPGSPADLAGLVRGDQLVTVDGTSVDAADSAGVDALNAALFPSALNAPHTFVFTRSSGAAVTRTLTSASVTKTPVPLARVVTTPAGTRAGYLVFNDHIAPSEAQLIAAMQGFQDQGLRELVVDLRYNGGGYLYIASELATMIAGTSATAGRAFESLTYNSKRSSDNRAQAFETTSCLLVGNNCTSEKPLPTLNLTRVYVLAQAGTCSASEALINGLRGVNVNVVLVGGKTCGKPYGFAGHDNCGVTYLPIEFVGVNDKGFGDYADGFEPTTGADTGGRLVNGCPVADDLGHALGDPSEAMLATALGHLDTGRCPVVAGASAPTVHAQGTARDGAVPLVLNRSPARSNRVLLPRH